MINSINWNYDFSFLAYMNSVEGSLWLPLSRKNMQVDSNAMSLRKPDQDTEVFN